MIITSWNVNSVRARIDNIKEYLKKKYNKPGAVYLGVTHRLDRPTSGAVIFTKTSKAAAASQAWASVPIRSIVMF